MKQEERETEKERERQAENEITELMVVSMKAEGKRKADKHVKVDTKALPRCQPRQTNALKHLFENVFIDFCSKTT